MINVATLLCENDYGILVICNEDIQMIPVHVPISMYYHESTYSKVTCLSWAPCVTKSAAAMVLVT